MRLDTWRPGHQLPPERRDGPPENIDWSLGYACPLWRSRYMQRRFERYGWRLLFWLGLLAGSLLAMAIRGLWRGLRPRSGAAAFPAEP